MSYAYRVTVSRTVQETVKGKDSSRNKVDLSEILPKEQMREMLERALEKRGFERRKDGTLTRTKDGVTETFDPKTMEVTATAEVAGDIKKQKTVQAVGDARNQRDAASQRAHAEAEVGSRLEKEIAVTEGERSAKRGELEREAKKRLDETEQARVRDLNDATLDVYQEAVKQKAKSLGTVKEMTESRNADGQGGSEYELIIKVEE